MGHRAGFEPATSRVAGEVTEIFTTDRDGVGMDLALHTIQRTERLVAGHRCSHDLAAPDAL